MLMSERLESHSDGHINGSRRENSQELTPFKENWKFNFSVLTISGKSGTGKTTLANNLAERYSIPKKRNIKVGELFFRIFPRKTNKDGFMPREITVDERVDNFQANLMRKAKTSHPYLLEGRLSGAIAYEEKINLPHLPVVSILLTASPDIEIDRLQKRNPELTRDQIIRIKKDREKKDLKLWRKIHKNLDNPNDPKFFNFVINTDSMSNEQVFIYVNSLLQEFGHISKKEDKTNAIPTEHQIFPKPSI